MDAFFAEESKVLVTHRRLFPTDEPRFFVGKVMSYRDGIVKILGRTFVRDMGTGAILPKKEFRIKYISMTSSLIFLYELPDSVNIDTVEFQVQEWRISIVDGDHFSMDLAEHHHN